MREQIDTLADKIKNEVEGFITIEKHELAGAADALTRLTNVYQLELSDFHTDNTSERFNT